VGAVFALPAEEKDTDRSGDRACGCARIPLGQGSSFLDAVFLSVEKGSGVSGSDSPSIL
jgi:hypothetical protein